MFQEERSQSTASVSVDVSAIKSRFPYFGCARNGPHFVCIQKKEMGFLVQKPPRKRLLHRLNYKTMELTTAVVYYTDDSPFYIP